LCEALCLLLLFSYRQSIYTDAQHLMTRCLMDPDILRNLFRSDKVFTKGGTNWSNVADPEIDELLDQGASESDPQKRKEIYAQIQQYMIDRAIILPIYVFPYTVAHSKKVEGLKFDLLGYPLLYDVTIRK